MRLPVQELANQAAVVQHKHYHRSKGMPLPDAVIRTRVPRFRMKKCKPVPVPDKHNKIAGRKGQGFRGIQCTSTRSLLSSQWNVLCIQ